MPAIAGPVTGKRWRLASAPDMACGAAAILAWPLSSPHAAPGTSGPHRFRMATSWAVRVRLSVGPTCHGFHPWPPTPSAPAGPGTGPRPETLTATGHRSTRAPLLRFCPLQRSRPCRAVRICHVPDEPASVFTGHSCGFPLRRAFGPRCFAWLRGSLATCLPSRARFTRACMTGPLQRQPHGSFIAGFYADDVPDPRRPITRPCRGLHTRDDAHGVWPFAVLLLPAGRDLSPDRPTHLPFPECPPRSFFVEGPAAQCCRVSGGQPLDTHRGFWAFLPASGAPAIPFRRPGPDCPGLCLFQVFGRPCTRRRELVLAPAVGPRSPLPAPSAHELWRARHAAMWATAAMDVRACSPACWRGRRLADPPATCVAARTRSLLEVRHLPRGSTGMMPAH
jgi:hypothetical protein